MNKLRVLLLIMLSICLGSCSDDAEKRNLENARNAKKSEVIFTNISNAWSFNSQPMNATSGSLAVSWNEWRVFLNELSQKPQSTIGAFRQKAKTLSLRVKDLTKNVPNDFNITPIRSRIAVLTTKVNSLNLFINLRDIPDQKVILLIKEINIELASLQRQMDEVVRKKAVPLEEGEAEMIRMLDTSRAIPNKPPVMVPENNSRELRRIELNKRRQKIE